MPEKMTKVSFIDSLAETNSYSRKQSIEITETILEIMKDSLASGEDLLVSGFGKFQVREKPERLGRNPATGDSMMLRERRVVAFKCSQKLRESVNGAA